MIRRAKKLFKEIKDSNLLNKKNKSKGANSEEDANIPTSTTQLDKKLRNSTSEKKLSPKVKRAPSFSSKRKASDASNSLPLPLNSDPSFQAQRERSITDPPSINDSPLSIKSKPKPLRAKSEAVLIRSPSRDKIKRSASKDKITREPLSRKRSLFRKKHDVDSGTNGNGVLEVLSVGSAPNLITPLDTNTFQVSFSVDNVDAYFAERLEGPIAHDIWEQMKVERGGQAMEERPHKKDDSRKANSLPKPKEATAGEDSKHNLEIMSIWDTTMAREIAAVCAQLEDQKRELLAEILLRESPAQEFASPRKDLAAQETASSRTGSHEFVALRKGKHARRGSAVAFNSTVEILELGTDGTKLKTSTAELCELPRPRPVSRKMRARMPSPLTIPSEVASLPSSSSPISSPFSSPRIVVSHPSPPVSPIVSPRDPHYSAPAALPPFSSLASPRLSNSPFASPRSAPPSPFASPRSDSLTSSLNSPRESPPPSPTTQARHSVDASPKPKAPLRAWARVFSGRGSKTRSNEVDPWLVGRAMEEEISQVISRCECEKLELLEEIELREIHEASMRLDAERNELLAEIARREEEEAGKGKKGETIEERKNREERPGRRHAMKLRSTLARRAAKGMDEITQKEEDEKMAKEIQEFSATNNVVRLGMDGACVKRPISRKVRSEVESRRNASLRAASRNAARKNLWIAEVPIAKVQENTRHT